MECLSKEDAPTGNRFCSMRSVHAACSAAVPSSSVTFLCTRRRPLKQPASVHGNVCNATDVVPTARTPATVHRESSAAPGRVSPGGSRGCTGDMSWRGAPSHREIERAVGSVQCRCPGAGSDSNRSSHTGIALGAFCRRHSIMLPCARVAPRGVFTHAYRPTYLTPTASRPCFVLPRPSRALRAPQVSRHAQKVTTSRLFLVGCPGERRPALNQAVRGSAGLNATRLPACQP